MGSKIILTDPETLSEVIDFQKFKFVEWVIGSLGIDENLIAQTFPSDEISFSVEDQIRLRDLCSKYEIFVIENLRTGELEIKLQNDQIAKWFPPEKIWRPDPKTSKYFLELHCSWWVCFEEE